MHRGAGSPVIIDGKILSAGGPAITMDGDTSTLASNGALIENGKVAPTMAPSIGEGSFSSAGVPTGLAGVGDGSIPQQPSGAEKQAVPIGQLLLLAAAFVGLVLALSVV